MKLSLASAMASISLAGQPVLFDGDLALAPHAVGGVQFGGLFFDAVGGLPGVGDGRSLASRASCRALARRSSTWRAFLACTSFAFGQRGFFVGGGDALMLVLSCS